MYRLLEEHFLDESNNYENEEDISSSERIMFNHGLLFGVYLKYSQSFHLKVMIHYYRFTPQEVGLGYIGLSFHPVKRMLKKYYNPQMRTDELTDLLRQAFDIGKRLSQEKYFDRLLKGSQGGILTPEGYTIFHYSTQ